MTIYRGWSVDFYDHKGLTWNWWSLCLLGLRSRSLLEMLIIQNAPWSDLWQSLWFENLLVSSWDNIAYVGFSDQSNIQLQHVEQNTVWSKKCSNEWLYAQCVLLSVCSRKNQSHGPKALKSAVWILRSSVLLYLGWERLKHCLSADYRNPSNCFTVIREAGT